MTEPAADRSKRGLPLQVAAELGDLLHELTHDPKARGEIGRVIRKVRPDSPHAAAFADLENEDRITAFEQKQADKELKAQQQAVLDRMNAQRASLLTGGQDGQGRKYSEEDIGKIEALMQKKGITDYDDGATLYAATLPPVNPKPENLPQQHGATFEFPEWSTFGKDPVRASRNIAHQVIDEFQRKRA